MMFLPTYPFKRVVSTIVAQNGLRRVKSFTGCGCRRYATAINVRNTDGFNKIADQIKRSENIVVVCGAGISTPSGLPDFRSEGTGLYDNIEDYELTTPTDVFDLRFFNHNPRPFFRLAKSLYPGNFAPNKVHYFLKLLSVKDKLRRIYTQNIDTLEAIAGVPDKEIIFAHGSFHTATCMNCSAKYKADDIKDEIMNEQIPLCRIDGCQGVIKPDIVFFGENLPWIFHQTYPGDLEDCDLMLILGTSLEVFPVAGLVYQLPKNKPRFLMNRDTVEPFTGDHQTRINDYVFCGDLMTGVSRLVDHLGWSEDLQKIVDS